MKLLLKTFTIIIVVVLSVSVLGFLFLYFIAIPDHNLIDEIKGTYNPKPEMEEKTRVQAQEYINTVFSDEHYVIYDIAFETNETEQVLYSYAAVVRNEENNIEFLVYFNNYTQKMEDNYVAMKWGNDFANDIRPFIDEHFGKVVSFHVGYEESEINDLKINPNNPGHYQDYKVKPEIIITFLERRKKAEDERRYKEFLEFLKS